MDECITSWNKILNMSPSNTLKVNTNSTSNLLSLNQDSESTNHLSSKRQRSSNSGTCQSSSSEKEQIEIRK